MHQLRLWKAIKCIENPNLSRFSSVSAAIILFVIIGAQCSANHRSQGIVGVFDGHNTDSVQSPSTNRSHHKASRKKNRNIPKTGVLFNVHWNRKWQWRMEKKKSGDEWWEPNQRRALVFAKRSRLMTSSRLSNISSHCTTPEKYSDTEIESTEQQQSKKYWIEVLSTPPLAVFSLSLSCSLIIHGTRNTSNIIQLAQVVSFNLCKSTSYKNIHFQTIGE